MLSAHTFQETSRCGHGAYARMSRLALLLACTGKLLASGLQRIQPPLLLVCATSREPLICSREPAHIMQFYAMYDENLGIHTAIETMYPCVFLNIRTCGAESAPAAIAALLSARVFLQFPTFLASRHLEICLSTVCRLCTISFASVECLLALSIRPSLKIINHAKSEKQSTARKWHALHLLLSTWTSSSNA